MPKFSLNIDDLKEWQAVLSVAFLISIIYLALIRVDNHPDIMEARNLVAARECIVDGHWLLTTMNGAPRVRKPPLPTWAAALSMTASGDANDIFSGRLPSVAMISLAGVFLYLLSRQWLKKSGSAFAAIVMATSGIILDVGRRASWDIFSFSFAVGGLWMFSGAMKGERKSLLWPLGSAVLWGLSFLSKGPVSFYTILLPYLLALAITKEHRGLHWRSVPVILIISTAIGASWWLYIYSLYPDAFRIAGEEVDAWGSRHVRSVFFYLPFPIFIFPWTSSFIGAISIPFVEKGEERKRMLFFLLWCAVAILLLTLIPEKKERYSISAILPASLAASFFWQSIKDKGISGIPYYSYVFQKVQTAVLSFAGAAAATYFAITGRSLLLLLFAPLLIVIGVKVLRERAPNTGVILATIITIVAGSAIVRVYLDKNFDLKGAAYVRELTDGMELYLYKRNEKLSWGVGRIHKLVNKGNPPEDLPTFVLVEEIHLKDFQGWSASKGLSFREAYRFRYGSSGQWFMLYDLDRQVERP